MSSHYTLSVIVPAFNEEDNIVLAVENIVRAIKELKRDIYSDYEVLVFDDASSDKTGTIADELSKENENIRVVHNETNRGLGYNYRRGIEMARYEYAVMFPGDNETDPRSIKETLKLAGSADIIIPYTANGYIRPMFRRAISFLYTKIINFLFELNLRYYNGCVMLKRHILATTPMRCDGFAFQTENLVRLIKKGYSFIEIPMWLNENKPYRTTAFRFKNICSVFKTIFVLILEVKFFKRYLYNTKPKSVGRKGS